MRALSSSPMCSSSHAFAALQNRGLVVVLLLCRVQRKIHAEGREKMNTSHPTQTDLRGASTLSSKLHWLRPTLGTENWIQRFQIGSWCGRSLAILEPLVFGCSSGRGCPSVAFAVLELRVDHRPCEQVSWISCEKAHRLKNRDCGAE